MNRAWLWTGLAVVLLGAGAYALYRYLAPTPLPEGILYANGHVEGTEVRVAAEVGGRVVDSALVEGEPVGAGAPLVRIDPADYEIALKQARAAIYPAVWGIGQLFTGAWSDRIGRKGLIVWGMWIQAGGIALTATLPSFAGFAAGGVLLGIGTAC